MTRTFYVSSGEFVFYIIIDGPGEQDPHNHQGQRVWAWRVQAVDGVCSHWESGSHAKGRLNILTNLWGVWVRERERERERGKKTLESNITLTEYALLDKDYNWCYLLSWLLPIPWYEIIENNWHILPQSETSYRLEGRRNTVFSNVLEGRQGFYK